MACHRRIAALAFGLLALAGAASAACSVKDTSFRLDLTTTDTPTDPIAKCLSSMRIEIEEDAGGLCSVTLTPLAGDHNYVPADFGVGKLGLMQECPTFARTVSANANAAVAIAAAINKHIYNKPVADYGVDSFPALPISTGLVELARDTDVNTFSYAVTETSSALVATLPTCENDAVCKTSLATECDLGKYGIATSVGKICAYCPAGTYSDDGITCTACPGGKASASVGADDLADCAACSSAGTFAEPGASDCQLCPAHTYAAASVNGVASCAPCADNFWAWVPGAATCVRCVKGVATTDDAEEPSPGYHVITLGSSLKTCNLEGNTPAMLTTCDGTDTKLSVFVDYDCSVTIEPITDATCAEPGSEDYNYEELKINGYYASTTSIKTLLPSVTTDYSTSYMLTIVAKSATQVTATFSDATSDPAPSTALVGVDVNCAADLTVDGGQVAGVPTAGAITTCPDGSYPVAGQYCPPCPTGATCSGNAKTPCAAATYQPLIGAAGTCTPCDLDAPVDPMTSEEGDAYCTIPYFDVSCGDGTEYDDSVRDCVACAAGYKRNTADPYFDTACVPCPAGQYADSATSCAACDAGEVAPTEGSASCTACPAGSIVDPDTDVANTACVSCPAGEYEAAGVCVPCDGATYRSGDASPENNVCKPIPAGYKAKAADDQVDPPILAQAEIEPCEAGAVSYWTSTPSSAGTGRQPATITTCAPCTGNTYAPRKGMQKCVACKAGTRPTLATGSSSCTACTGNTYRSAFSSSATCDVCVMGSETKPSGYTACTQCRPGFYMAEHLTLTGKAASDACTACPLDTIQPKAGQVACSLCGAGYYTSDDANTECSACPKGTYKPTTKASWDTAGGVACKLAPLGTFVNTTAATAYSLCPIGTFANEEGSDSCDACPPGSYANVPGSKTCKTCPAGTFSRGRAFTCNSCQAGYFSAAGSGACSPCKAGFYAKDRRSGTCAACPLGTQCPVIATVTPTPCPAGYFANKEGSRLCTPCPINFFALGPKATRCSACPAGTNTRGLTGQSRCQAVRTKTLRLAMF